MAIALVLRSVLAVWPSPGWQAVTSLLGLAYLYLGAAALAIPDHDGSWGTTGGVLALAAGAGFLGLTIVDGRRAFLPAA